MFEKDGELYKISFYLSSAIVATIIKFIKSKERSYKMLVAEILTGASFAFFLVPMIVEHWDLTLSAGTGLTWILTIFSKEVLDRVKSKLIKKIDDTEPNND